MYCEKGARGRRIGEGVFPKVLVVCILARQSQPPGHLLKGARGMHIAEFRALSDSQTLCSQLSELSDLLTERARQKFLGASKCPGKIPMIFLGSFTPPCQGSKPRTRRKNNEQGRGWSEHKESIKICCILVVFSGFSWFPFAPKNLLSTPVKTYFSVQVTFPYLVALTKFQEMHEIQTFLTK